MSTPSCFSINSTASAWANGESAGAVTSTLETSRFCASDLDCVLRVMTSFTAPSGAQLLIERMRQRLVEAGDFYSNGL